MKTQANILTSSKDIFLIDFNGQTNHFIFENENGVLAQLIKTHCKYGILQIRRYNHVKTRFEKINKELLKTLFSWDTESIEELRKTNFIK